MANVCPASGVFLRHGPELGSRESILLLTRNLPFRGSRSARSVRVYSDATRRSSSVLKRVYRPQNTALNRHPARPGITIRIEAASARVHIKVDGFDANELCRIAALWHGCVYVVFFVPLEQRRTMKC